MISDTFLSAVLNIATLCHPNRSTSVLRLIQGSNPKEVVVPSAITLVNTILEISLCRNIFFIVLEKLLFICIDQKFGCSKHLFLIHSVHKVCLVTRFQFNLSIVVVLKFDSSLKPMPPSFLGLQRMCQAILFVFTTLEKIRT